MTAHRLPLLVKLLQVRRSGARSIQRTEAVSGKRYEGLTAVRIDLNDYDWE
jgi:hypothetical protein